MAKSTELLPSARGVLFSRIVGIGPIGLGQGRTLEAVVLWLASRGLGDMVRMTANPPVRSIDLDTGVMEVDVPKSVLRTDKPLPKSERAWMLETAERLEAPQWSDARLLGDGWKRYALRLQQALKEKQ